MEIEVVQVAEWMRYPWLTHGFSTRMGGVSTVYGGRTLNLGWTREDAAESVYGNRRLLMERIGATSTEKLATLRQVHGTAIHRVRSADEEMHSSEGQALYEGDGLMTAVPGMLLGMQTADCVPVMIVDVKLRAVAVLHAGWRGTAAGMVTVGIERMRAEYGSQGEDLAVAIGPAIGACCYAVGKEVRDAFCGSFVYGRELFIEDRVNLWEANRRQLVDAGVPAERITMLGECTACARTKDGERRYFSHRAEHGMTGRMMSVAGIRHDG